MSQVSSSLMPRRSSFSSRPHLSTILSLYPEEEPRCAGIARTQGRRCRLRTNACGRKAAVSLLDRGTEALHAGRDITRTLRTLAPHVLCTRWHQGQASELFEKWQRQIAEFLESVPESSLTDTQRPLVVRRRERPAVGGNDDNRMREQPEMWTPDDAFERMLETRLDALSRVIEETEARLLSELPATNTRRRRDRNAAAATSPGMNTADGAAPRRRRSQGVMHPFTEIVRPDVRIGAGRHDLLSLRVLVSVEIEPVTAENGNEGEDVNENDEDENRDDSEDDSSDYDIENEDMDDPAALDQAATSRGTQRTAPTHGVRRQLIEGECGICLEPLRGPGMSESRSGRPDDELDRGLSWCRAQCGVNYHTSCIDEWVAVATTCPHCRATWGT
ncbi:hypothetical protein ASPCAL04880 [Aspergillus calidoustus]|uniref:RING-type domain-containing protein n=1 Tax=Aspergillus calidoustus TaxID=454130 RepID=A0A0U5FWQ4_ASPCI|nr:hypothetical protein ASPCAL04880 [Aspergillus calidoustus]